MRKKSPSTPRGTKAGEIQSFQAMVDTPAVNEEIESTSYGKESQTTNTGDSSAHSETRHKAGKTHTRQRQRRETKVDPQTLLEIAQTALARLGESGVQVLAYPSNQGNIIIMICGASVDRETRTFRLTPPDPLYNQP